MGLEQKWMANGSPALVLDAGQGEPGDEDYRPALVAVLATEYHEPAQVLDSDPLAELDTAEATTEVGGATRPGIVPGELRGPAPAPQPLAGPATPTVTTRSTAAEDPNVTVPGSPAAVGVIGAAQIIATLRDLTSRAEAGDADAQAELDQLGEAFDADRDEVSLRGDRADTTATRHDDAGVDVTSTTGGDRTQADTPETAPGGNGAAAGSAQGGPAGATGAGEGPPAA